MKRTILALALLAGLSASARGLTPSLIMRNGLTDEQIDAVFAANSNATIRLTAQHWRNLEYRMHRFDNMKGWLNEQIEGRLGDTILAVTDTNRVVIASNETLRAYLNMAGKEIERLNSRLIDLTIQFTNQVAQTATYSNMCVIVEGQAQAAQAKIQDEIADLNSKIAKYEDYKTKYPLFKTLWNALIADAQNRIKVLEALTVR